jgi:hypothetical protein
MIDKKATKRQRAIAKLAPFVAEERARREAQEQKEDGEWLGNQEDKEEETYMQAEEAGIRQAELAAVGEEEAEIIEID